VLSRLLLIATALVLSCSRRKATFDLDPCDETPIEVRDVIRVGDSTVWIRTDDNQLWFFDLEAHRGAKRLREDRVEALVRTSNGPVAIARRGNDLSAVSLVDEHRTPIATTDARVLAATARGTRLVLVLAGGTLLSINDGVVTRIPVVELEPNGSTADVAITDPDVWVMFQGDHSPSKTFRVQGTTPHEIPRNKTCADERDLSCRFVDRLVADGACVIALARRSDDPRGRAIRVCPGATTSLDTPRGHRVEDVRPEGKGYWLVSNESMLAPDGPQPLPKTSKSCGVTVAHFDSMLLVRTGGGWRFAPELNPAPTR